MVKAIPTLVTTQIDSTKELICSQRDGDWLFDPELHTCTIEQSKKAKHLTMRFHLLC